MPTRRYRTRTTTASAITESTSPWTMAEPVRSGGQPRTNGSGSSTSRACGWKLSMADSPANRSPTTAPSTSSWPVARRAAWTSRQGQGAFPHTGAREGTRRTGSRFAVRRLSAMWILGATLIGIGALEYLWRSNITSPFNWLWVAGGLLLLVAVVWTGVVAFGLGS